jgi:hypothetical protein
MMRSLIAPVIATSFLVWAAPAVASSISFVESFRNQSNTQTGNGNSLTFQQTFYSADLITTVANPYTSAAMTYPGPGSPRNLPQTSSTDYGFQTPALASKAVMDAQFPTGTYVFKGTNGATTDTASYNYTTDDYVLSVPFLTGTDFTSLQGMDTSKPFTFHFSPDVTGPNATFSFIFFTIFDFTKNASAFNAGFLNPSTTSVTLAANTLTGGDLFGYELDFSNRDLLPSPGAVFQAQLGFDVRTDGTFRAAPAAVPEPSTLALLGVGSLAARISARRRKKS